MTKPKDTGLSKGALFDDMGNLIQAPGGAPFINERGNIEVRQAINQDRIVERNAGCWSCIHLDIGQVYDAKVNASYSRDVAAFKSKGLPEGQAHKRAAETRRFLTTKKGLFGTCLAGKTEGDFVSVRYLCENWTGKTGASLARAPGEPLSPLVAEGIDKLPEPPKAEPKAEPSE